MLGLVLVGETRVERGGLKGVGLLFGGVRHFGRGAAGCGVVEGPDVDDGEPMMMATNRWNFGSQALSLTHSD